MTELKVFVGSNDIDPNFELKMSSLFKLLQEVAVTDAESMKVGSTYTMSVGQMWVVTRIKVEIYRMPKYQENIFVSTYPGETMKIIFPRYFEIKDLDGNIIVRASSTWAVLDQKTRRISLKPFPNERFAFDKHEGQLGLPKKVAPVETNLIENRKVRYCDCDLNGHLNNTKYIDFIVDTHDADFYKTNRIKTLNINYQKEVRDNEHIMIFTNGEENETITGYKDKVDCFSCYIEYEKR